MPDDIRLVSVTKGEMTARALAAAEAAADPTKSPQTQATLALTYAVLALVETR